MLVGIKELTSTSWPALARYSGYSFFGKLAEEKDVIDIKETTFDASKFLLNYIYTGSEVGVEGENGLEEVFGIINLAEKYDD